MQEVVGGGVLVEAANEIGDGCGEVGGTDDGRVEQYLAVSLPQRLRLRRGHAFEHLERQASLGPACTKSLDQAEAPGDIEEVVRRQPDINAIVESFIEEHVEQGLVAGVHVRLRRIGRERPAVQLGVNGLHGEIGAFHHSDLDPSTTAGSAGLGPLRQFSGHAVRVGKIGLKHDAGVDAGELRFVEHPPERGDRESKVAVLLHVEVDEGGRCLRLREPVQVAQCFGDRLHGCVEGEGANMRAYCRDLDRYVVHVLA